VVWIRGYGLEVGQFHLLSLRLLLLHSAATTQCFDLHCFIISVHLAFGDGRQADHLNVTTAHRSHALVIAQHLEAILLFQGSLILQI
jgi:hypothetical protein